MKSVVAGGGMTAAQSCASAADQRAVNYVQPTICRHTRIDSCPPPSAPGQPLNRGSKEAKMTRSRAFSIYLLKRGYDASNSLKEDHTLEQSIAAEALPPDTTLFVLDGAPRPPWWKGYSGVDMDLNQVSKGALVFLTPMIEFSHYPLVMCPIISRMKVMSMTLGSR
jgi:hypothetical protein